MNTENTVALPKPSVWSEVKLSGLLGYGAIWAFFIIFLIYPLIRLFYDSFTTEAGDLHHLPISRISSPTPSTSNP